MEMLDLLNIKNRLNSLKLDIFLINQNVMSHKYLWSYTNDSKAQFWSKGSSQCYLSYECKNEYMPDNLINNEKLADITLPKKTPVDIFNEYSILAAGILNAKANYYHSRPKYPYHIILLVSGGTLSCAFDNKKESVKRGNIIAIPSGQIFEENVKCRQCKVLWIHVKTSPEWNLMLGNKISVKKSKNFEDIMGIVQIIKNEIYKHTRSIFFLKNATAIFAELLKREFSETSGNKDKLIIENLSKEISNFPEMDWKRSLAAKRTGYSESKIDNLFERYKYCSFAKFVLRTRMEKALKALCENKANLKELAKTVGYSDNSSFSKAFKKYYGRTPKACDKISTCQT